MVLKYGELEIGDVECGLVSFENVSLLISLWLILIEMVWWKFDVLNRLVKILFWMVWFIISDYVFVFFYVVMW